MRGTRDANGREDMLNNTNGQYNEHAGYYPGSSSVLLSTPGDRGSHGYDGLDNHDIRNQPGGGFSSFQPTLGQMADQFQERARVERKEKISRKKELIDTDEKGVSQYDNSEGYNNYDDGSDGDDGGDNNYGYDDVDGDGDGDGGDDDPGTVTTGNESTGRWTRPEHELFLQALKKYGKVRRAVHACICDEI